MNERIDLLFHLFKYCCYSVVVGFVLLVVEVFDDIEGPEAQPG